MDKRSSDIGIWSMQTIEVYLNWIWIVKELNVNSDNLLMICLVRNRLRYIYKLDTRFILDLNTSTESEKMFSLDHLFSVHHLSKPIHLFSSPSSWHLQSIWFQIYGLIWFQIHGWNKVWLTCFINLCSILNLYI